LRGGDRRICGWSAASIADAVDGVRLQLDRMEDARRRGREEALEAAKRTVKEDYLPLLRTLIRELPRTCAFTPPKEFGVQRLTDMIDGVEALAHYEDVRSARESLRMFTSQLPEMLRKR